MNGWNMWKVENLKRQWLRKYSNGRIHEDGENLKIYKGIKCFFFKQRLEEMKNWTKKTMVEEDERFNKLKKK